MKVFGLYRHGSAAVAAFHERERLSHDCYRFVREMTLTEQHPVVAKVWEKHIGK